MKYVILVQIKERNKATELSPQFSLERHAPLKIKKYKTILLLNPLLFPIPEKNLHLIETKRGLYKE